MNTPKIKIRNREIFYHLASFDDKQTARKYLRKFVNTQRIVGYKKAFCFDLSKKMSKPCYGIYVERLSLNDKDFFYNVICYGRN